MWITRLGIKGHEAKPEVHPPVVLKRDIWGSLPDDVLDRVIARMPLSTLIRMQMVFKKWRIKLRTASFIRLYKSECERARTEWFLTFGNQKTGTVCFTCDVLLSKRHTLPLGFLPFEITNQSPLAAADGFICLGAGWNRGVMPSKLVICNPVSRIPAMHRGVDCSSAWPKRFSKPTTETSHRGQSYIRGPSRMTAIRTPLTLDHLCKDHTGGS